MGGGDGVMTTKSKLFLVGIDCNCYTEGYAHQSITLCPLHEAAPKLLEALKEITHDNGMLYSKYIELIRKAEGSK